MAAAGGGPSDGDSRRGAPSTRALGQDAERRAAEFLASRGLVLLESNFTCKGGEIDLVCDDHGTLVFVEVRSRKHALHGAPEETITPAKRRRIVLAARHYLLRRCATEPACRFDVVVIEGDEVRYLPDAFDAG
jgi:putative endonuclease